MVITVILFLTRSHVKSFQVISGPLAKNRTYTALAIREEAIVNALCARFDGDREAIKADVAEAIKKLKEIGVIDE